MPPPELKTHVALARVAALAVVSAVLGLGPHARAAASEPPPYAWPVSGPVLRGFEPPPSRFQAGHRGIDIGAPLGSPVRAAADGTVAFAGWVAGSRFVSIDHPDGIRTTYSWLSSIDVARGATVVRGQVIATTGHGHPEVDRPHLHFGARVGDEYLDPLVLLGAAAARIHLAPLDAPAASEWGPEAREVRASWGSALASGLPPPEPLPRPHWLWSRVEPKPLVVRRRGPPAAPGAGSGP
jgi:murein DD-endopeptidase MepM/ murein hydrolase activator NlpD